MTDENVRLTFTEAEILCYSLGTCPIAYIKHGYRIEQYAELLINGCTEKGHEIIHEALLEIREQVQGKEHYLKVQVNHFKMKWEDRFGPMDEGENG